MMSRINKLKIIKLIISWFIYIIFIFDLFNLFANEKVLKAVFNYYPPYEYYVKKENVIKGINYETVRNVFSILGVKVIFEEYPWERCLTMIRKGDADAIFSLLYSKEREEYMYFIEENISFEENVFFTLKDLNIKWDGNIESIRKYKIGCVKGYVYGKIFDEEKNLEKFFFKDDETIIKMLMNRRIDIGVGNIYVIKFIINELNLNQNNFTFLKPSISKNPLFIAFSKLKISKGFVKEFNETLVKFKRSNQYKDLLIKYEFK